jgi:hypothetical protein
MSLTSSQIELNPLATYVFQLIFNSEGKNKMAKLVPFDFDLSLRCILAKKK